MQLTSADQITPDNFELVLGTALWYWKVDQKTAFDLLDRFTEAGGRWVDTATNYPIRRDATYWRRTELGIYEWLLRRHPHAISGGLTEPYPVSQVPLRLIVKLGARNNLMDGQTIWLPRRRAEKESMKLLRRFGSCLGSIMPHWDNRTDEDEIGETWSVLSSMTIDSSHLQVGLSGLDRPENYEYKITDLFIDPPLLEVKHNVFESDAARYSAYRERCYWLAYGLSGGGLKLNPKEYAGEGPASAHLRGRDTDPALLPTLRRWLIELPTRPDGGPLPATLHDLGLLCAYLDPRFKGALIGPSSVAQLDQTLEWFTALRHYDYADLYEQLQDIMGGGRAPEE